MAKETTEGFRRRYRRTQIAARYSGWGHLLLTTSASAAAIVWSLLQVEAPSVLELSVFPLTLLYANVVEYFGHRGPLHRPWGPLKAVYAKHIEHHLFFPADADGPESSRDFKAILFPPAMIVFFIGGIALPTGLLLQELVSRNAGHVFTAAAISAFLAYELLHWAYHQEDGHWTARLPFVAALRRHHRRHHALELMGRYNFNVTVPLMDYVLGTVAPATRPRRGCP